MPGKLITLTEDSVAAIKALIAEDRRKYGGTLNRPGVEEELGQPPECYVAKTPPEGIPAMIDEVPGYADCDIYRILVDGNGNPYFHPVGNLTKTVYNLKTGTTGTGSTEGESGDIGGDSWITVIRDKFGNWLIAGGGGGGGGEDDAGKVKIKNESGSMRTKYDVLELLEPVLTPTENLDDFKDDRPFFIGVKPTGESEPAKDKRRYCIILQDLEDISGEDTGTGTVETGDDVGLAVVSGVVQTQISVSDESHTFAEVEAGQYRLKSAASGTAKILWKESGTGTKWAMVLLGTGGSGGNAALIRLTTSVKDANGYQDGFIRTYDTATNAFADGTAVLFRNHDPAVAALPLRTVLAVKVGHETSPDKDVYAAPYDLC